MKKLMVISSLILSLSFLNAQADEVYSLRARNPATSSIDSPFNLSSDVTSYTINFILLPFEVIFKPIIKGFLS